MKRPSPPALLLRKIVQKLGLHPDDRERIEVDLTGRRALVIATNHGMLDIGKPTGVFASELTAAYYAFLDAGMQVDVASPAGGLIPVEPLSVNPIIRTPGDDRLLADEVLRSKITDSLPIASVDINAYDIVYLAGGWGAAYDLGFSEPLGTKITEANAAGTIIGGICHGPLGLINATGADGRPLVEGRRVTGVSNRQVRDLRITHTPQHPETELRRKGALYESSTRISDVLANHWVVDGNLVTGQNQNAGPMVAREMLRLAQQRWTGQTQAPDRGDRDRDMQGRARQARPRDRLGRPLPYGSVGVEPVSEQALPPLETISAAHELLAEGRPFSAHEVYEARWKAGPAAERELWQGLAQLCVGITHAERGNRIGALRLIERARRRLETYAATGGPVYGLDLGRVIEWIREREGEPDNSSWLINHPL